MSIIQHDLSPSALVHAIEANTATFLLSLGRAGGGEIRDDVFVQWVIGGSPINYHNSVVRANLTQETADAVIHKSLERMAARNVSGSWHVGPSMTPPDLHERLIAHGFTLAGNEPGMAVDLDALREDGRLPAGLTIEQIRDEQRLEVWTRTLSGFGAGGDEIRWVGEMYRRIGFGGEVPWRHFLALLDGVPVATTSLLFAAGVAGIYFVYTIPEARHQGIGAAITLAALREARTHGYRIGVLGASAMGYPVYRRLGFEQYCTIHMYEWRSE